MHSIIGKSHRRAALSGEAVMQEALRAPRREVPRGLANYTHAVHAAGATNTAEFRLRQQQGLRIQASLRGH